MMKDVRDKQLANIDWITIILWTILVIIGWMNIYSANFISGDGNIFDFTERYGKQMIWIAVSILLIIIIFLLDPKFYLYFAYPAYGVMIFLLIAVFLFGREINGAKSWFVLAGFQFQPSEFAKPFTALALAQLISSHGFSFQKADRLLLTGLLIISPAILIMIQPDLGSSLVYFAFLFVLYREGFSQNFMILGGLLLVLFILTLLIPKSTILLAVLLLALIILSINEGLKKISIYIFLPGVILFGILYGISYFLSIALSVFYITLITLAVSAIIILVIGLNQRKRIFIKILTGLVVSALFVISVDYAMNNVLKEHQRQRIYVTLGLEDDPQGIGYNLNQSKIAIGSGGFSGKGYLKGTQTKLQFVPEQSTDFIFCTIGEEWGFMGTSFVVLLYIFLIIRLIQLAERQRSHFSRIFGYGLISVLFLHFIVNIGMTIGLLPVIGIPLPFISYGGSSMLAFTVF
ncbi:rod shape-determining protein RodA, partial [Bacteroidota bacterium]